MSNWHKLNLNKVPAALPSTCVDIYGLSLQRSEFINLMLNQGK